MLKVINMAENIKQPIYKPFSSFVARSDNIQQHSSKTQVFSPRKAVIDALLEQLSTIQYSKESRILPVLGSAGYGKTALYHALRDGSIPVNAHTVYIPTPTTQEGAEQLYPLMYFQLIKQIGIKVLQEAIGNLKNTFGTLENAIKKLVGKEALVAEMLFALSEEKFHKTAKFLLTGLKLENPILPHPGNLHEDSELAFFALKVIAEYSNKPIIYFFDEIEGLFVAYGDKPAMQLLERIKRVYNEQNNTLIVLASLTQVWENILDVSTLSTVSRFENPVLLRRFTKIDLDEFVYKEMNYYILDQMKIKKPTNSEKIWPFTEQDLSEILENTGGNPREVIKSLRVKISSKQEIFDEFSKKNIEIDSFWLKAIKNSIKENDKIKKYALGTFEGKFGPQISLKKEKERYTIILSLNRTLDQLIGIDSYIKENLSDSTIVFISEFDSKIVKNELGISENIIQLDPEKIEDHDVDSLMKSLVSLIQQNK
ncbi:MAG: hypothetical protein HeimC3_24430 [Candidatus Heimdallarchaeota archaeon LC_3]|nr:MAG: hypothetical protein HeimC3_24430 [Candidatus Heimdallarchaeota archaeon LC_3]